MPSEIAIMVPHILTSFFVDGLSDIRKDSPIIDFYDHK